VDRSSISSVYLPGGSTVVTSAPSSVVRLISYASGSSVDPTVPMSFGRSTVGVDPSSSPSLHPTAASATTASPMGSAERMVLIGAGAQLTAFFTSALIFASSVAVNFVSAKEVGHMAPSSRFAVALKPNDAYLSLNFDAGVK
jgi:hypothetical protein